MRRRPPARRLLPWLLVALAGAVASVAVAGCGAGGGGGSISSDQFSLSGTQRDARFIVGSEGFTEQEVLGNITIEALEAAGADVVDRTGLGGNEEVRDALEADEIDMYWEYTATGWLVFLDETNFISSPQKQYEAVARQDLDENGVRWLPPAPGDDTYAIAASRKTAKKFGVQSISDFARFTRKHPDKATLCFNNDDDFRTRFDGLPGMERAYGFEVPEDNLVEVSSEAVYEAAQEGEICNFGVVFTTSGFIEDLNLKLLEDDENFFAVYNPSLTMKRETLQSYPQLRKLFAPISKKLDTGTLRRLNYKVDVEDQPPDEVARRWLRQNGFIE